MITTEWQSYDPARHGQCAGNYMFLLKPFQHAPYYAGETGCFDDRFTRQHGSYFRQGFRTFMRPLFISEAIDRTHAGFAAAWHKANPKGGAADRTRIHVARDRSEPADPLINAEGIKFWLNKVVLLICQTATTDDMRYQIEASVQQHIMAYYERLLGRTIKWQIPKSSRLVGPAKWRPSDIRYSWRGWGNAVGPNDFFRAVQIANFAPYPKTTVPIRRRRRAKP